MRVEQTVAEIIDVIESIVVTPLLAFYLYGSIALRAYDEYAHRGTDSKSPWRKLIQRALAEWESGMSGEIWIAPKEMLAKNKKATNSGDL